MQARNYNNLTWLEPAIQSKTSTWAVVNSKKNPFDFDEL